MARNRSHIAVFKTLLVSALFALPATQAIAQDKADEATAKRALDLNITPPADADVLNLSSTLSGAIIDLPSDALSTGLLNLDLTDTDCLTVRNACFNTDERLPVSSAQYNKAFSAGSVIGLDLELQPRASLRFNDEESSALVGAVVRIGDDLRGTDVKKNTWYVFAGADAEAMTYSPNSVSRLTSGEFGLQDRVIVGDAQAGIGYRIGDADVSLGYFRREVSSIQDNDPTNDFSLSEDAAALSFTWRR